MRSVGVLYVCIFLLVAEFNSSSGFIFGRRRRRGNPPPQQQVVTVTKIYKMTVNIDELVIDLTNNRGTLNVGTGDLQASGGVKNIRVQVYEENGRQMALLEGTLGLKIPLDMVMRHASSMRDVEDN